MAEKVGIWRENSAKEPPLSGSSALCLYTVAERIGLFFYEKSWKNLIDITSCLEI